jgi:hypothetical protein
MTTGRINQVTTFQKPLSWPSATRGVPGALSAFTMWSSSLFASNIVDPPQLADTVPPLAGGTSNLKPTGGVTLFPVLTCLEQDPLVP